MDQAEKTLLYEKHKKMVEKICKTISAGMNIEYDDVLSEANLVFVHCSDRWDNIKGPFDKFLSSSIYFRMFTVRKKLIAENQRFVTLPDFEPIEKLATTIDYSIEELINSTEKNCALSHDSEIIKNLLYSKLDKCHSECGTIEDWQKKHKRRQLITQRELRSELRKNFQWPHDRINAAFQEITASLP